jgi:hypothetical protein
MAVNPKGLHALGLYRLKPIIYSFHFMAVNPNLGAPGLKSLNNFPMYTTQ